MHIRNLPFLSSFFSSAHSKVKKAPRDNLTQRTSLQQPTNELRGIVPEVQTRTKTDHSAARFGQSAVFKHSADPIKPAYKVKSWDQLIKQPPNTFEVEIEVNNTDRLLWGRTIELKNKEIGIFEAFDHQGKRLHVSDIFSGDRVGTIEQYRWMPVWQDFVESLVRTFDESQIASVRFTQTRSARGFLRDITIRFISPSDMRITFFLQKDLSNRLSLDHPKDLNVNIEKSCLTFDKYTIGDILDEPSFWRKVKMFLGLEPARYVKTSAVLMGKR